MTVNDRQPPRPPKPRRHRPGHLLFRLANKARNALGPTLFVAVLVLVSVIAISMVVIDVAERRNPHVTSVWSGFVWVVLALVAAPPWAATTPAGKVIKYVVNLLKPTTIALMTAALTTYLFQLLVKRNSGMGRAKMKDHIVLCGWSSKGAEIIKEIRGRGDEESERPIVILADLHANPTKDDLTTFVHGDPTEAGDLRRAGIERARTAIILADNSYPGIDAEEMDSRTLLTTLTVESINPACYTCVEVIHSENRDHFSRTKADEMVVSAHLTGALLAHSAVNRGLSRVVDDLLTFPGGNEFYWLPVTGTLAGTTFKDALAQLKEKFDCLLVAMASADKDYLINPASDRLLEQGDRLLVISRGQPEM